MKILIFTTQPHWGSWDRKISACRAAIGFVKNARPVQIDVREYGGISPVVVEGKISRSWFNVLTIAAKKMKYHAVVFHFSEKEAKRWGIVSVRGCHINDEVMGEMYLSADENSKVIYKKSGRVADRFVKVFLHEMSHWIAKSTEEFLRYKEDPTHFWDYEKEFIAGAFAEYELPLGFKDSILAAFRREKLSPPLKDFRRDLISQPFGERSSVYRSGIHPGCDFAVPVGTPVLAPADGVIVRTWKNHVSLGNAFTFEFYLYGRMYTMRCAHLRDPTLLKEARRGSVIGVTGNTGKSTGPHLHLEVWKGGYNVEHLFTEETVRAFLVNPWPFFSLLKTY